MKSLITVAICAAVALPFTASAQSADAKYCDALSATYRTSGANKGDSPEAVAMSKCAKDPASAIPVLEKSLKDSKIPLPARG